MSRFLGVLGVLLVLALSMGFAALNGGQRLTLRLGFTTLYRIPLSVVVFGSVILGMLVMMVAGIRSDLRVRRILRDRLAREDEEERARIYIDRNQKDLFEETPDSASAPGRAAPAAPPAATDTPPEGAASAGPRAVRPDVWTDALQGDPAESDSDAEAETRPDVERDDRSPAVEEETRSPS